MNMQPGDVIGYCGPHKLHFQILMGCPTCRMDEALKKLNDLGTKLGKAGEEVANRAGAILTFKPPAWEDDGSWIPDEIELPK